MVGGGAGNSLASPMAMNSARDRHVDWTSDRTSVQRQLPTDVCSYFRKQSEATATRWVVVGSSGPSFVFPFPSGRHGRAGGEKRTRAAQLGQPPSVLDLDGIHRARPGSRAN
jgi:hypothetical protein